MLGISRNSVREALRILDGLGFVQKLPNRRVVATSPNAIRLQEPLVGLDDVQVASALGVAHYVRILVEQTCARLAAERRTEADLAELDSHLASFAEALKRRDYSAASHAHVGFHRAIVSAANNPILTSFFDEARRVESDVLRRGRGTFKDRRQLPLHAAIVKAIRDRDPDRAAASVRKHFQTVAPLVEFLSKE
jgi:DNA-binding GntR family transcriptional regulator